MWVRAPYQLVMTGVLCDVSPCANEHGTYVYVEGTRNVADLKRRMACLMDVEPQDIAIAEPDNLEDPYPDWVDVPNDVRPKVIVSSITIVVHDESGYENISVSSSIPMRTLHEMIAHRLGGLPHFIDLHDENGDAWMMTMASQTTTCLHWDILDQGRSRHSITYPAVPVTFSKGEI